MLWAVVIVASRVFGAFTQRIGQPRVIAEMVTGILLGPSLLGFLAPDLFDYLFPSEIRTVVYFLAQISLVLYMFCVGLEFDTRTLKSEGSAFVKVSIVGILAPFTLGCLTVKFFLNGERFFGVNVPDFLAMLFLGAAISITAFPVLARILYESKLANSRVGRLTLAAGSIDDAVAWGLLAFILASLNNKPGNFYMALWGTGLFVAALVFAAKPLFHQVYKKNENRPLTINTITISMAVLLTAAWFTDVIGIHAAFGAFLSGAIFPKNEISTELREKLEPLTTSIFIPMFFIYSGLNTKLDLLIDSTLLGFLLLILLVSTVGKGVACYLAGRWSGYNHYESLAVGTLMNARGMMELILLNIGLQHGLITSATFSILAAMAVITTVVASPIFRRLEPKLPKSPSESLTTTSEHREAA